MGKSSAAGLIAGQLFIVLLVGIGWVMNILDLVGMELDVVTIELILRVIGIVVVPLGAIMGYFV